MHTKIFEGEVVALSSISHIGDSYGVNAKLRRETLVQPDGSSEQVPVISGNSIRGILRDRGMLHMVRSLGYSTSIDFDVAASKVAASSPDVDERDREEIPLSDQEKEAVKRSGMPLAAFYFLFSGGSLKKEDHTGRGIDVDEARRWRNAIPLVSVFGGAMGNQIMPGRLKCGKMYPLCRETAHLVPERFVKHWGDISIWDMCQEEAYTRKDDEKDERLRYLIDPEKRLRLEADATAKREAIMRGDPDADVVGATGQKQQMRYYVETLAAGIHLAWDVVLDDVSDLEFDAFCITLAEFSRMPYIGGKSATGHGKVSIHFDKWTEIDPRLTPTGKELDVALGVRYLQHLKAHAGEIRELIDGLV